MSEPLDQCSKCGTTEGLLVSAGKGWLCTACLPSDEQPVVEVTCESCG